MGIYEELKARGLIAQVTNEDEIRNMVNAGKATFYIGFDCTADSLTAGHFMALTLMKRLQEAGNKPIALIGGGTTMIGDPSGRTDMRRMLTKEDIDHNAECFRRQMERFIDFGEGKARMINNADWLLSLNYIELLREVGACFSVNNMLRAECYKQRMERGLSFLEFNYMIMQSYDFYYLYKNYGCNMQFGGDDQWSNMLGGTELIRRKLGADAHAMTITLLTDSQGHKMGKTAGNAVWLDPNKTSPFDFYQYWRNVADADVLKCIRMLTFLPLEQIDEMDKWEGSELNRAKEILAYELTKLVHGKDEADKADAAAKSVFGGAGSSDDMPSTELSDEDFTDGTVGVLDLLLKAKLAPSRREGRTLIMQGGVLLDGEKVTDPNLRLAKESFGDGVVIKKGKKTYHRYTVIYGEMKRYDIILFDADGTLYDFDRSEANAVSEVLALCSLPVNDETVTLYHEINDAEWKALERGETTRERLKYDRFRKLKDALSARGITTDASAEEMCNMYVERLSRQCIPYPEAEPVCRELSARGCRLYIITNGITAVQHGRFDRSPLTKYFDGMFVSDEMGTVKPERRYFELVLDAVGITHTEAVSRALVVGDSLTSDIAGAAAAGLDSVWYDPLGRAPGGAKPTYIIKSLYELYDIILPIEAPEG